ncbi:MAG: class I poly(R)-hydroxyalkanoic acid synthase [Motiliproteus sp.]
MDNKDTNNTSPNFFAAMNTETHKVMELFGGKVGEEHLDNLNNAWSQLLDRPHDPQGWIDAISEYQKTQMQLWSGFFTSTAGTNNKPAPGDRRFNSDEWSESPVFNYIKESYLIASSMMNKLASSANLDEKKQKKLEFYTQQYIDAMSPSNFAATNPEVLQQALDTKGQSLIDGLQNLMGDMDKGRISMTDEEAFTLGENIGTSKGSVVFQNEIMQLIQYNPSTEKVAERPLLIVPPCINKFYILDLQEHNSYVKYAVDQGNTVFLISWVNATPAQSALSWDDYVESGVFKALDVAKNITGSDRVNTVAWCVGGTIVASALAVLAARKDNTVSSATFLTTLLDFEEPGDLGIFIDEEQVGKLVDQVQSEGILNGKSLSTTFNMLRSNDLIWSYVVNNYLKGQAPAPFDILYWNSDPTNLPADFYCYYINNMYVENNLKVPGKLTICGESIDLTKIKTPCYFLSCIEDHIAPWESTFAATEIFSNIEFVLGASGHIAGVINPASKNRRNFWIGGETGKGTQQWLDSSEKVDGSWWNHWNAWLNKRGGKQVAAPEIGSKKFTALEAAPGSFVKERIV